MKRNDCLLRLCVLLLLFGSTLRAQEPKVPQGPPPPELVGRWLEKTAQRKGDLVGCNIYLFGRNSEFLVVSRVLNEKTKTWVEAKKLFPKERPSLAGYYEVTPPGTLKLHIVVLAMAVLPFEAKYSVRGDTLRLSKGPFEPLSERAVTCTRAPRLPGEPAADAAAVEARIESALHGPDFREVFESAAHEMKDHPSDAEMIARFDEHREEFEVLRGMMQADKHLKRVDYDWTEPKDLDAAGVTAERIEQYRALCRKIGLERGVSAFGESARSVTFLASTRGLGITGSSKSYVWLSEPPQPTERRVIVDDLDAYVRQRQEERTQYFKKHKRAGPGSYNAFRKIEEHWYLEYQYED